MAEWPSLMASKNMHFYHYEELDSAKDQGAWERAQAPAGTTVHADPSPQKTQRALSGLLTNPNCEVINGSHGRALHEMASTGEMPSASSEVHACDLQ